MLLLLLQGQWALPGGFVDQGEPLHAAAARELQEETSVNPDDVDMFQVRLQVAGFVSKIPVFIRQAVCSNMKDPGLLCQEFAGQWFAVNG
jgi:8-oxo-dGTP pyrophosphatase MutT (NUDIX family)